MINLKENKAEKPEAATTREQVFKIPTIPSGLALLPNEDHPYTSYMVLGKIYPWCKDRFDHFFLLKNYAALIWFDIILKNENSKAGKTRGRDKEKF